MMMTMMLLLMMMMTTIMGMVMIKTMWEALWCISGRADREMRPPVLPQQAHKQKTQQKNWEPKKILLHQITIPKTSCKIATYYICQGFNCCNLCFWSSSWPPSRPQLLLSSPQTMFPNNISFPHRISRVWEEVLWRPSVWNLLPSPITSVTHSPFINLGYQRYYFISYSQNRSS